MWSLFILSLTVGLGASVLEESSFTGKRDYVYRYMAQTVFGLPGTSRTYSGVKVVCNIRFQFLTSSQVVARLEDIELYSMNGALLHRNPLKEQIDPDFMTRFYRTRIVAWLNKPFTFMYTEGYVYDINTPKWEPYWSVNIKRGILSLMEVNLNKRFTPVRERKFDPYYTTFEMSASGLCRNIYTVEEPFFNLEIPKNTLVVTKTRDFKNCTMRPQWYKTMNNAIYCKGCNADKSIGITEGSQVRFTLKGNRERFVILSAIGENYVTFHPYKADQGHMATIINQTMFLVDATDIGNTRLTDEVEKLTMIQRYKYDFIPEYLTDSQKPFAHDTKLPLPIDEMRYTPKQSIINALKTVAESMTTEGTILKTVTEFQTYAVSLMRRANFTVLKEIWDEYALPKPTETETSIAMRKTVWHCTAMTGNYWTGKLILNECVVTKKLPTWTCAMLINMVSLANNANNTLVKELIRVTTDLGDGEDPQLIRSLWLAIGTLTNKMKMAEVYELRDLQKSIDIITELLEHEHESVPRKHLAMLKQHVVNKFMTLTKLYEEMYTEIVALIKSQLSKAGIEPKILALKTAGNAGLPELIPVCGRIAKDEKLPEFVRFTAVWSLLRMSIFDPHTVREMVTPILMKPTDNTAVRIAAFTVLIYSRPPRVVLEMLARHINREPDLQVASYMYKAFVNDANLTHPCFTHMSKEMGRVLHTSPKLEPGVFYSKVKTWELMCPDKRIPGRLITTLGFIGSKTSMLPQSISLSMGAHVVGKTSEVLEVGLYTEELRTALEKLIGPNGILTKRKSILDMFSPRMKRSARSMTTEQKIELIFKKLGIKERETALPMGSLYVKLFGYEMRYFTLDEMLRRLATSAKISTWIREENHMDMITPIDYHTPLYMMDLATIIPTDAGIPVQLRVALNAAYKVKGMFSFRVLPSLFESKRQSPPDTASLTYSLRNSGVMEIRGIMGTNLFDEVLGTSLVVRTKINKPLMGNFTASLPKRKIIAAIVPPIQEEPLVEVEAYPVTYQTLTPTNNAKIINIAEEAKIIEKLYEYGNDSLGLNMINFIKWPSAYGNLRVPVPPMTGRAVYQYLMRPGPLPPKIIKFQAQVAIGPPIKPMSGGNTESSCECAIGRLSLCLIACPEEDETEPEIIDTISSLEDFPNLVSKDVTIGALKSKMQMKLGSSLRLSPVGHKWGCIATVDFSNPAIPRKMQIEALWQAINNREMHQFVMRLTRTPLQGYPMPWEAITTFMMQYPTRVVNARTLIDPRYQIQLIRNMNFMTRSANHRPIIERLNMTVMTMLNQHIQKMYGDPKPEHLLRSLALTWFSRYNDSYTARLVPIWRRLIVLSNTMRSTLHQSIDPIYLVKHVDHLRTHIAELEQIQYVLMPMLKLIPFPITAPYITEALLMEHQKILYQSVELCYRASKMSIIPDSSMLWPRIMHLYTKFHIDILESLPFLVKLLPQPSTVPQMWKVQWLKLQRVSVTQMDIWKHIIMSMKNKVPPTLQPLADLVSLVRDTLPTVLKTLKENPSVQLEASAIFTKLAREHYMLKELMTTITKTLLPRPKTDEMEYVRLMNMMKAQTSSLSMLSSVIVKFKYDNMTLIPTMSIKDIHVLYLIQKYQLIMGIEMIKVKHLAVITPHSLIIEPEQIFSEAEEILKDMNEYYCEVNKFVTDELLTANVEPNIKIYEKVTLVVLHMREIIRDLKTVITRNAITVPEVTRCVSIIKECEKMRIKIEELRVKTTQAFNLLWRSASIKDTLEDDALVSKEMIAGTLMSLVTKQREVHKEISRYLMKIKMMPTSTIQPWIGSILDTCRGLQDRIDWIQLWGIPLHKFSRVFAHVIAMQKIILRNIREMVTLCENRLENPTKINFYILDLEEQLNRVIKLGSVEWTGIMSEPHAELPDVKPEHIPTIPSIPYPQPNSNMPGIDNPWPPMNKEIPEPIPEQIPEFPMMSGEDWPRRPINLPHMPQEMPLSIPMNRPWKMPNMPINPMTRMESTYFPLAFTAFLNITWGEIGITPHTVVAKMYATKSFEQLLWETKQLDPINRDPKVEVALGREEAGMVHLMRENPIYRNINTLKHRHISIRYTPMARNIPTWIKYKWEMWLNIWRSTHAWNTIISPPVSKTAGVLHIVNEGKMDAPVSDTYVMTPNQTISVLGKKTWLTTLVAPYNPITAPWWTATFHNEPLTGPYWPAQCKVNFDNLRTFDGVEYKLPNVGTCETLLSADCSDKKEWLITMRTETGNSDFMRPESVNMQTLNSPLFGKKKILTILAEDKTIVIKGESSGVAITVDGEAITLDPTKPWIFEKTVSYGERVVAIKIIEKQGILVQLPLLGLYIYSTGNFVNIKASTLFRRKTCGLCSNMDSLQRWEYEAADKRIFYTPESFISSYIITGPTCPIKSFLSPTEVPPNPVNNPINPMSPMNPVRPMDQMNPMNPINPMNPMNPMKPMNPYNPIDPINSVNPEKPFEPMVLDRTCQPTPINIIKYKTIRNVKLICFSIHPYLMCPSNCRSVKTWTVPGKQPFFCTMETSTDAYHLKEQVKSGIRLRLSGNLINNYFDVEEDETCK